MKNCLAVRQHDQGGEGKQMIGKIIITLCWLACFINALVYFFDGDNQIANVYIAALLVITAIINKE